MATIRLSNCTASFVSADGLILTNHHCAESCLDENSTSGHNLVGEGFLARTREQELKCGQQIADVLMEMENVTAKIQAATAGLAAKAANDKRKSTITQLEQACESQSRAAKSGALKCEMVNLYEGGQYWLYKYHRYTDVRLVFAPERAIAAFGGDPDNFQFPRWCLDMSVLRAYNPDGKPAATPAFLRFRADGPKLDEAVFVSGHPGSTQRLLTVAELEDLRNFFLPRWLLRYSELRGRMIQYGKSSPEAHRIVEDPLNGIENSIKVRRKQLDALLDERLMKSKRDEEAALRAKVAADPQLAAATGDPWGEIARAEARGEQLYLPYLYVEQAAGFNSRLFGYARTLVRARRGAAQAQYRASDRVCRCGTAARATAPGGTGTGVPGPGEAHPVVLARAHARVAGTGCTDRAPAHGQRVSRLPRRAPGGWDAAGRSGGAQAPVGRRRRGGECLHGPDDRARPQHRCTGARRAQQLRGRGGGAGRGGLGEDRARPLRGLRHEPAPGCDLHAAPDLRHGEGLDRERPGGRAVHLPVHGCSSARPARSPSRCPDSWLKVKGELDMQTKFDLATTSDITGGNSGSPLIDAQGRIVGLMFDGNIHSVAGDYWYDPVLNRAVAVDPTIMFESLRKVYKANELLAELAAK